MAQNVIINSVTYQNVPEVDIPKSGPSHGKDGLWIQRRSQR